MNLNKLVKVKTTINKRIIEEINNETFELSIEYLQQLHKNIFKEILIDAGEFRWYDISKPEETLNEESVQYANHYTINTYLEYIINESKNININNLSKEEFIEYIATFISSLWIIHPFNEGNTRVTTIFLIKYLKTLGFNISNEEFKNNSKYYRAALVKATYSNEEKEIIIDKEPLKNFLKNIIYHENIKLKEEDLYVKKSFEKPLIKKKGKHEI